MRKKIALFANGWSSEFLIVAGESIRKVAAKHDMDVFIFINYNIHSDSFGNKNGEFNIFKLPDLTDFDGVIVVPGTFNMDEEISYLHNELLRTGVPSVSLDYFLEGIDYIGSDDYSGMYELADHLIVEHNVKNILFIGGMREHEGSNIRLKAVADSAANHGLDFSEDNVIYGDFSAIPAVRLMNEWIKSHNNQIPDAVVCANDMMALGICKELTSQGYNIPRDVIVTGFDYLEIARNHEPSVTSVSREWATMGTLGMETILKKIAGQEVEHYQTVDSHLIREESCGCPKNTSTVSPLFPKICESDKMIDSFTTDQHFRHMNIVMRKVSTPEEFNVNISNYFIEEGWLEGDRVLLAFHPNFFLPETWDDIKENVFPEQMDIICRVDKDHFEPVSRMNKYDILFSFANTSDDPDIYISVPIRVDDVTLGFAVLSKGLALFRYDILFRWCRHMTQYTEQIKSNVLIAQLTQRLESLSVTDCLTNVYNRTGCETKLYPALISNQATGGRSVILLADVDRLKYINDNLGHNMGDIAITTSVEALKKALPDNYMIGRFGGDEFLIVACEKDEVNLDNIVINIENNLAELVIEKEIPFKLTISVGAVQLEKGQEFDIKTIIKNTDEKLYKIKEYHHSQSTDLC